MTNLRDTIQRLTIEEVEKIADETYDYVKTNLADQLVATMRENERLHALAGQMREALDYALWQYEGGGTPEHNHWSGKVRETLAAYDEAMNRHPESRDQKSEDYYTKCLRDGEKITLTTVQKTSHN